MCNGLPRSRFLGNIYGGWPFVMGFRSRVCRLNEPGLWGEGWPCVMGFRCRVCRLNEPGLWGEGWPWVMGFRGRVFWAIFMEAGHA